MSLEKKINTKWQRLIKNTNPILTDKSEHVTIDGLPGKWYCIGSETVDGKAYFAMDSETESENSLSVVIDQNKNIIIEEFRPWEGDIEDHIKGRIKESSADVNNVGSAYLKSDFPDINRMLEAINSSYQATGRSDRWVFDIDGIEEGPYIYNPLYFSGNAYCGTPEELDNCARRMYEKRFGEQYNPCLPTPTKIAPFFGMIEYLGNGGAVGEINLFTDEVEYLKGIMEKENYGVPLRATRLTADEYKEIQYVTEKAETMECDDEMECD